MKTFQRVLLGVSAIIFSTQVQAMMYPLRPYEPNTASWLTRDPIGEVGFHLEQTRQQIFQIDNFDGSPIGDEQANTLAPNEFLILGEPNAYCFNNNNAIILIDAFGLSPFCVCIQADNDHAWISVTDMATGDRHTYGRWKAGYPRSSPAPARTSGVNTDMELKRGYGASRCLVVSSFTPTINAGYDAYNNNCATYAQSEWERASGEDLTKSSLSVGTFDHPSVLKDSVLDKNGGKKSVPCACASPGGKPITPPPATK